MEFRQIGIESAPVIAQITVATLRDSGLNPAARDDTARLCDRWDAYLRGVHHPQQALSPRIAFGAFAAGPMVGFLAGHFSRRFGAEGELQSIYVLWQYQRQGIGTALLMRLAEWFTAQDRRCVCVGIEPGNPYRRFYQKHGARYLNPHWLQWDDIGAVRESAPPKAFGIS